METKICPRCDGSGEYSYNMMHGRVCFKCGGIGKILANPRAKGCAVTSLKQYADVGDVIQLPGCGTCKVVEVQIGEFKTADGMKYPQRLICESLIDGKRYRSLRFEPRTEQMLGGKPHRVNKKTNVWYPIED